MTTCIRTGLIALALTATTLAAQDIVGRWDLKVGDRGLPSWIGVSRKGGDYEVHYLGTGGGVNRNLEKVKVEGNTVSFRVNDRDWEATAQGDAMTGTFKGKDGAVTKFTGRRFVPPIDVSGTWKVHVEAQRGKDPALVLMQKGDQIMGTWKAREDANIEAVHLADGTLKFRVPESKPLVIEAQVKGDVMEGTAVTRGYNRKFTAQREREWGEPVELFNGKDMSGWKVMGDPAQSKWSVVSGVLANADRGANIVTEKAFKDFKILVEFRVPKNSNSGVYLRGRYEIQVEDSYGKTPHGGMCGAMYSRLLPSENAAKPADEWQTFEATLIGQYFTLVHNGKKVIDNQEIEGITGGAIDSNEYEPGPIYIQGDHGPVEYRKVTVWPAREPRIAASR